MQRVKVKVMPLTFVSLAQANMPAIREILVPLPRDGIFLLTSTLLLETSFPGARDFYATAWRYAYSDCELFFALASRGELLITVDDAVLVCVDPSHPWTSYEEVFDSITSGRIFVVEDADVLRDVVKHH